MAGHETTVMGVVVEGLPHIVPRPERVELMDDGEGFGLLQGFPGGRGRWRSVCIGVARGSAMCEFSLSGRPVRVVRPPGPPTLKLGFVQNIVSTKRIATYSPPSAAPIMLPAVFTIVRDPIGVGNGLLDCGNAAPPWFQGKSVSVTPLPPTAPSVVHAFDNPRWSIPLSLSVPRGADGTLKRVEMADHFRLYAVACDGRSYYPLAYIEWGTDITFTVQPGQPPRPGQLPTGSWTGRRVWSDPQWQGVVPTTPIVTGPRANDVLVDKLVL